MFNILEVCYTYSELDGEELIFMKEVRVDAGIVQYEEHGSGQPIVLLHGTLSNTKTWRKVTPLLSQRYRCIVPALPLGGHAVAMHPDADLTPNGISVLLKQLLEAIGLDSAVLAGNDTGGAYAQLFAATYPASVSRLVLSNTDAFEVFPPRAFAMLQAGVHIPGFTWMMSRLFRYKPILTSSFVLGLLSHSLTKEEIADLYVSTFVERGDIRADFAKVVKSWSPDYTMRAAQELNQFDKPVLVIWGADDHKLFPVELGKRLQTVFPHASLRIVENSLTYIQEDQPEVFAKELDAFLQHAEHQ
jgi:pimeloyl-ACP methyl ester carboxylesterase